MGEDSGRSKTAAARRKQTDPQDAFHLEAPVSSLVFVATSVLSLTLIFMPRNSSIGVLTTFGWGDGQLFWQGELWRVWVNSLLHNNVFHFLCNIYWFLRFSPVLEALIGSRRYLIYLLVCGWVVGLAGNLTWEEGGIGLSGLIYFIFAFLVRLRGERRAAARVCDRMTCYLLGSWLVIGPLLTLFWDVPIGNIVHLAGFGYGLAAAEIHRRLRCAKHPWAARLMPAGAHLAILLPLSLYLYAPIYNPQWHYYKAYSADTLDKQVEHYDRLLALAPENNKARYNLGLAYYEHGKLELAEKTWLECAAHSPQDPQICRALFAMYAQRGDPAGMELWARRQQELVSAREPP